VNQPQQPCSKLRLEVPLEWLENPHDGDRNRIFFTSLLIGLAKLRLPLYYSEVPFGADRAPRRPSKGEYVFAYHAIGNTPNVAYCKEAPIPPLYSIDLSGYAGWSAIASPNRYHAEIERMKLADAKAAIQRFHTDFHNSRASKYPQQSKPSVRLPQRFVFLPLQVQNDSVSNLSPFTGLELLAAAATEAKRLRFHLVAKRHPFCHSFAAESALRTLSEENEYFTTSDANIHDLIEHCHSVITVNSGVGMEALIHGKAVYCTGRSEWAAAATRLQSLDDVGQAFSDEPDRMNPYQEKLIAFLLSEYWVDPTDQDRVDRRLKECLASFDPDYGDEVLGPDVRHALNAELLRLHAELDHQKRIAKLAMIDFEQAKKEALSLRKDARLVRAAKKVFRRALAFFKPRGLALLAFFFLQA
jgi:hypothetical protein